MKISHTHRASPNSCPFRGGRTSSVKVYNKDLSQATKLHIRRPQRPALFLSYDFIWSTRSWTVLLKFSIFRS